MTKNKEPQGLGRNKSLKSKFGKATLALAGAGVLAGALGGGQAMAAGVDDDMGTLPQAGHSAVSPGYMQAAYKNVQDTMNWCSDNPYTTAGIVLSTTGIAATTYMVATGQIDIDTVTQTATQTSAKIAEFFNDPQPTLEYLKTQGSSVVGSVQSYTSDLQTQAGELVSNLSGQASTAVQNAQTMASPLLEQASEGIKAFSQAASDNLAQTQDFLQLQGDGLVKSLQSVAEKLPPAQQVIMSGVSKIVESVDASLGNGIAMAAKNIETGKNMLQDFVFNQQVHHVVKGSQFQGLLKNDPLLQGLKAFGFTDASLENGMSKLLSGAHSTKRAFETFANNYNNPFMKSQPMSAMLTAAMKRTASTSPWLR